MDELERMCKSTGLPLALDLSDLRSADTAAVEALRALRGSGVQLLNVRAYISRLLGRDYRQA